MLCSKERLLSRVSSRHPVGNSRSMRIDVTIHALLVPSWSTSSQNFSVAKDGHYAREAGTYFAVNDSGLQKLGSGGDLGLWL